MAQPHCRIYTARYLSALPALSRSRAPNFSYHSKLNTTLANYLNKAYSLISKTTYDGPSAFSPRE
ncbi:hypothetical protein BABINDRAFT_132484 [Babjeviella inositovora NRRL Y-12698]|uniref:Uncharacterized protein n=1 Tax=Babjeviella inositovora NRRL Y-12698 TaxID=984486 RepID=A0A1E3QTK4_9ASCO|nr:uncharacterized protein BABINDRAFT_132484 [Babjeviella inositovora NRRL Y-12698]ODQ80352.1 hypothetical protein BABINDRAFT_132484 [Babjeviella inositovora NRRL Y-12698]